MTTCYDWTHAYRSATDGTADNKLSSKTGIGKSKSKSIAGAAWIPQYWAIAAVLLFSRPNASI